MNEDTIRGMIAGALLMFCAVLLAFVAFGLSERKKPCARCKGNSSEWELVPHCGRKLCVSCYHAVTFAALVRACRRGRKPDDPPKPS